MIHKDQLNRMLNFNSVPNRIVCLVPSQTELLVDLGLEDKLVGLTKFCVHPKQLIKSKTVVGGTKQINISKIKALNPDIILCNKEENSQDIITQLEGVAPIHISDIYNLEDCFELINKYGELFEVKEKASAIIRKIIVEQEAFRLKIRNIKLKKAAYFIWKKPWMVAASNTFIDVMLEEAGFKNAFKNLERYPEISLEHSNLEASDIILLSSEPFPFKEKHIEIFKKRFPSKPVKIIDGELFSWYGSRLIKSFAYFETLHNE